MKKKFLTIIFLFFLFFINLSSNTIANEKIIENLISTNSIKFSFKQNISGKIEEGICYVKYPKLIKCDYDDSFQKRLISNGKTLAIIQRRYKKIFYYSLKQTPLFYILDKNFLINFLSKEKPIQISNDQIIFEVFLNEKKKILIKFDSKLNIISGWKIIDSYKNDVKFEIFNHEINYEIDDKIFKIPKENEL